MWEMGEFLSPGRDCTPGHCSNCMLRYAVSSTALWLLLANNSDCGCRKGHSASGDTEFAGRTADHFCPTAWLEPRSPGPEADVDYWWMTGEFPSLTLLGGIHVPLCYVVGRRLSNSTFTAMKAAAPWATQLPREKHSTVALSFQCLPSSLDLYDRTYTTAQWIREVTGLLGPVAW